jgi:DNA-binding transcriptional MerR regulator
MARKTGKTTPEAIASHDKKLKAVRMREDGFSLEEIADALGWNSPQAAHKAIKSVLDKAEIESATNYKILQVRRIEKLLATTGEKAAKGNIRAAAVYVRLSKRLSEITGCDAPAKFAHEGQDGGPLKVVVEYANDPADPS